MSPQLAIPLFLILYGSSVYVLSYSLAVFPDVWAKVIQLCYVKSRSWFTNSWIPKRRIAVSFSME